MLNDLNWIAWEGIFVVFFLAIIASQLIVDARNRRRKKK